MDPTLLPAMTLGRSPCSRSAFTTPCRCHTTTSPGCGGKPRPEHVVAPDLTQHLRDASAQTRTASCQAAWIGHSVRACVSQPHQPAISATCAWQAVRSHLLLQTCKTVQQSTQQHHATQPVVPPCQGLETYNVECAQGAPTTQHESCAAKGVASLPQEV